jgi:hypothetical protein
MIAGSVCITEKQKSYYDHYDHIRWNGVRFKSEPVYWYGRGVIKTTEGDIHIPKKTVYVSNDVNFGAI